jgi:hypothetical protein
MNDSHGIRVPLPGSGVLIGNASRAERDRSLQASTGPAFGTPRECRCHAKDGTA